MITSEVPLVYSFSLVIKVAVIFNLVLVIKTKAKLCKLKGILVFNLVMVN